METRLTEPYYNTPRWSHLKFLLAAMALALFIMGVLIADVVFFVQLLFM